MAFLLLLFNVLMDEFQKKDFLSEASILFYKVLSLIYHICVIWSKAAHRIEGQILSSHELVSQTSRGLHQQQQVDDLLLFVVELLSVTIFFL